MKKNKKQELRSRSVEELQKMTLDTKEKLAGLRFNVRAGKTANIKEIHALRKEHAIIQTIIKEQHGKN